MARNVCVCVCVYVCVRACLGETVCAVCVFSFKRRKTTVVTERSRKISYQIAEPTLVPRGLWRAAESTINAPTPSTPPSTPPTPKSAL